MADNVAQPSVTALRRWLYAAALLRSISGKLASLQEQTAKISFTRVCCDHVTELYGRTFAVWTLTTCVLCLICARDPKVPAIYGATLFSFLAAFLHFGTELLVFKTMTMWTAASPLLVAGISVLWMGLGWSYYTNYAVRTPGAGDWSDKKAE